MRASASAGTSGDPQARIVRVDDKSEISDRTEHRRGAAESSPAIRKDRQGVSLRPLAPASARVNQRVEPISVDRAEGRGRADDDRRAEDLHPEEVAQRRASG